MLSIRAMITRVTKHLHIMAVTPDPVESDSNACGITGLCPLEISFPKKQHLLPQTSIGGKGSWSRCCLGGKEAGENIDAPEACSATHGIGGGSR